MRLIKPSNRPLLFVLRVWLAESGEGNHEWRGDIQHVASREKRYFREWAVLLDFLQAQVQAARANDFPPQQEKPINRNDSSFSPQGGQGE